MALTLNHLFAVIMLSGAFSLVSAMLFVVMDAVDVAFTEAAVGAGVSTVLMLSTMAHLLCGFRKRRRNQLYYQSLLFAL